MLSEDEMIQRVLQRTAQKAMVAEAAGQVKDRPDAARPAERSRNTARNAPDHPASSKAGARILAAAKPKAENKATCRSPGKGAINRPMYPKVLVIKPSVMPEKICCSAF